MYTKKQFHLLCILNEKRIKKLRRNYDRRLNHLETLVKHIWQRQRKDTGVKDYIIEEPVPTDNIAGLPTSTPVGFNGSVSQNCDENEESSVFRYASGDVLSGEALSGDALSDVVIHDEEYDGRESGIFTMTSEAQPPDLEEVRPLDYVDDEVSKKRTWCDELSEYRNFNRSNRCRKQITGNESNSADNDFSDDQEFDGRSSSTFRRRKSAVIEERMPSRDDRGSNEGLDDVFNLESKDIYNKHQREEGHFDSGDANRDKDETMESSSEESLNDIFDMGTNGEKYDHVLCYEDDFQDRKRQSWEEDIGVYTDEVDNICHHGSDDRSQTCCTNNDISNAGSHTSVLSHISGETEGSCDVGLNVSPDDESCYCCGSEESRNSSLDMEEVMTLSGQDRRIHQLLSFGKPRGIKFKNLSGKFIAQYIRRKKSWLRGVITDDDGNRMQIQYFTEENSGNTSEEIDQDWYTKSYLRKLHKRNILVALEVKGSDFHDVLIQNKGGDTTIENDAIGIVEHIPRLSKPVKVVYRSGGERFYKPHDFLDSYWKNKFSVFAI